MRTASGSYHFVGILFYSEIWNRWNPTEPVDLVSYYLQQAEADGNKRLIKHILRDLGNIRASFVNPVPILDHCRPYLLSNDPDIQELAIKTFGQLRSNHLDAVDSYLSRTHFSQQEVIQRIHEATFSETFSGIVLQARPAIESVMAYTPPSKLSWLFNTLDIIKGQENLSDALRVIASSYFDTLE